ncbi:hypothetical protein AB0H37_35470 [Actinomadura sp. NPDC023710]|uniref:hypothetical protein n=1 Tax=Actinomadura sp. NPDC023710 TaxID=3158219 RepID=UPI0033C56361
MAESNEIGGVTGLTWQGPQAMDHALEGASQRFPDLVRRPTHPDRHPNTSTTKMAVNLQHPRLVNGRDQAEPYLLEPEHGLGQLAIGQRTGGAGWPIPGLAALAQLHCVRVGLMKVVGKEVALGSAPDMVARRLANVADDTDSGAEFLKCCHVTCWRGSYSAMAYQK